MRKILIVLGLITGCLACTVPEPPEPPYPPPIPGVEVVLDDPGRETVGSLMGPAPSMVSHSEVEVAGVRIRAELRRDGLGVEVRAENRGQVPVQLPLQEWSLTGEGETAPVVTGDIPNSQAQSACIGPVTLPPGGVYHAALVMRKMHALHGGRYVLEPMHDGVILAYVIATEAGRNMGTLALGQK